MHQLMQSIVGALLGDYPIVFLGIASAFALCPKPWLVLLLIPANVVLNVALVMLMHRRMIGWNEFEHFWLASLVAVLVFSVLLGMFIRAVLRGRVLNQEQVTEGTPQ